MKPFNKILSFFAALFCFFLSGSIEAQCTVQSLSDDTLNFPLSGSTQYIYITWTQPGYGACSGQVTFSGVPSWVTIVHDQYDRITVTCASNSTSRSDVFSYSHSGGAMGSIHVTQGTQGTYYRDQDGDNYGDPNNTQLSYGQPSGYVSNSSDCNDGNANVHPGAVEVCDGVDNNCNGQVDENLVPDNPTGTGNERCGPGTITLTATPGSGGNRVLWYDTPATGGTPLNTDDGTLFVPTVTTTTTFWISTYDQYAGCESSGVVAVTATVKDAPPTPTLSSVQQPTCDNAYGTFTITNFDDVSYNYTVTPSTGVTINSSNGTVTAPAGNSYTVKASSSNGCTSANSVTRTVNQQPIIPPYPEVSVNHASCTSSTGSITVTNSGVNNSGHMFSFDGGATFQASNSKSGLTPGNYDVIIQRVDSGCESDTRSVAVQDQSSSPTAPSVDMVQPDCFSATGSITVTSPLGQGYEYSTDGFNFQSTPSFTGLPEGRYDVVYRDSNGCTSQMATRYINAQPPIPDVPTLDTVQQPTCDNAYGTFTITNFDDVSYDYTVTPSTGVTINSSNGTVTAPAGNSYTIKATIPGGCSSGNSVTRTVNQQPIGPPFPQVSVNQPSCTSSTGTITVTNSGVDNSGHMFSFDGGTTFQASISKSGLAPGNYDVVIRYVDSGCDSGPLSVPINNQPAAPSGPGVDVVQPDCSTATGSITITGLPIGTYTYSFDDGNSFTPSSSVSGLEPNNIYGVRYKDGSGCVSEATYVVMDPPPTSIDQPEIDQLVQPTCSNPSGSFVISNYNSEYSYEVYPSDGVSIIDDTVTTTLPDDYTITAIWQSCTSNPSSLTINPPPAIPAWYPDSDGDGFGDAYATPEYDCNNRGAGWADNNDDLCPDDVGIAGNFGCPAGVSFENRNWITAKSYDLNATLKSSSKSYYNDLGKLEQTQSLDIETNRTWASQVLYDSHGRSAIQSLSAPVNLPGTFLYQTSFMQNQSGSTYSLTDFADTASDPSVVGEAYGTLGWYYSDNNDDGFYEGNDYQDITDHPFSRTIYSTLNPGSVLKSIGGNKVDTNEDGIIGAGDEWPQAYSFTMPAGQELSQTMAFGSATYNSLKISKTIIRDVHGTENVVFADSDGKVLASARSGNEQNPNQQKYSVTLSIGEQAYVDIHIPKGCSGVTLSEGPSSGFYQIEVYDLVADTKIFQSLSTLQSGFYRIAVGAGAYDGSEPYLVTHDVNYYDYSLNEYDEADRLVKSYQPIGTTKATKPFTEYTYNGLGQLVHTSSPDEGEAWFKYREDGQIRFSQNSKQKDPNEDSNFADAEFSYTEYDDFGRPIESGVLIGTGFDSADPDGTLPSGTKKEQQFTTYDLADDAAMATALGSRAAQYPSQSFVAGNVAYTNNDVSETWYSYDVYGRVKWLVQNIQGLGAKTIDYEYDPITGLVTRVIFQEGVTGEQFIHRYGYDSKDRLVTVETSTDDTTYELHAEYFYFETGGLKRVELADGAQGVDYVYNLAGQLKSINHPALDMTNDPGGDGNDLFGMQLDYHNNDFARPLANIGHSTYGTDQINGNIKGIRWGNTYPNTVESEYVYSYDRNNWLVSADFDPSGSAVGSGALLDNDSSSATFTSGQTGLLEAKVSYTLTAGFNPQEGSTVTVRINTDNGGGIMAGDYDVSNITYDANGNIQSLVRNKGSQDGSNAMDALSYVYGSAKPNQLQQVLDAEGDVANADDIGNQTDVENYKYNEIGQLTDNLSEGITYIYNASGLVTEVGKDGQPMVKFFYNDRNQRVKKESYSGGLLSNVSYYVRDVAGNVMAIYSDGGGMMHLAEQPVYGNGRVGVAYTASNNTKTYVYELTDHLGNVRTVFTKNGNDAQLESKMDYYPFGMPMPNRSLLSADGYRYAFQGQEKDPETGKEAFQLRLWDGRIGRWLTTDPYRAHASPYLGMANNPSNIVDPDGGCPEGYDCFVDPIENSEGINLNEVTVSGIDMSPEMMGLAQMDFGFSLPNNFLGPRTFMPPIIFKAGETYNIETVYKVYFDAAMVDYSDLRIGFDREKISTSGFSLGAAAGPTDAGIFTKFHSQEMTFYQDVQGRDLLDVFDNTGLINANGFGATIHYLQLRGYDSPQTMNLIWETHLKGHGLSAGFNGSRSVPTFENANNQ